MKIVLLLFYPITNWICSLVCKFFIRRLMTNKYWTRLCVWKHERLKNRTFLISYLLLPLYSYVGNWINRERELVSTFSCVHFAFEYDFLIFVIQGIQGSYILSTIISDIITTMWNTWVENYIDKYEKQSIIMVLL